MVSFSTTQPIGNGFRVVRYLFPEIGKLNVKFDCRALGVVLVRRQIPVEVAFLVDDGWRLRGVPVPRGLVAVSRTVVSVLVPDAVAVVLGPLLTIFIANGPRVVLIAVEAAEKGLVAVAAEQQQRYIVLGLRRTEAKEQQRDEKSLHCDT